MSRKLVIGDIHGGFIALKEILEKASLKKNDQLIFLGDYVDGWSQAPEVIDLLIELDKKYSCIFIRGNHDQIFLEWLLGKNEHFDEKMWINHGGRATIDAYKIVSDEKKQIHMAFLKNLQNYYIDDTYNLYVHAGFTNMHGVTEEYFSKNLYWDRTLWELALCINKDIKTSSQYYPKRLTLYNEVFIGHTPTTRIGMTTPQNFANVWNLDTGAAFKGPLTIMDVNSKQFWQSKPLNLLYPLEKGRN
jgi:serine/threonine protein phosphatase 1